MISRSLYKDLQLSRKKSECNKLGGCIYGKPFKRKVGGSDIRNHRYFYKVKCKRCRQEIVLIESELEKYGGLR